MPIRKYPDKILDDLSVHVHGNLSHSEIIALTEEMKRECWSVGGFGISAVQIGKPYRIFGYVSGKRYDLDWICDPEIISASGRSIFNEGCLSIPGYYWPISRHEKVTLRFKDLSGKSVVKTFSDIEARVVQHEMDHLDGILIPDLMNDNDMKKFVDHYSSGYNVYSYDPPDIYVE